jgi:hypothetical protein
MPLTLVEVVEKLKDVDEITLMERLEISSEDLVSRFIDRIEDKYDEFSGEFNDTN